MQDTLGLFGGDDAGEAAPTRSLASVAEQPFHYPATSFLDGKSGVWLDRKREWIATGIKSEVGRDVVVYATVDKEYWPKFGTETSVFDPVLCELAYTWYCPVGGQIVDPFAGGSVRGLVAGAVGRRYWGCDLRREQIDANNAQALDILGATIPVKVSAAMLRQQFHSCEPAYVSGTCRGRCCESSNGIKVTIHATEADKFRAKGAVVEGGFIVADERGLCPFKTADGLCGTHEDKPLGCRFSPFTLNNSDTLIVRNRYRLLKCYNCENAEPAYKAHGWSLAQVFGEVEAARITKHLDEGGGDLVAAMPAETYAVLRDNDAAKGTRVNASYRPTWVCGDSAVRLADAPAADFIFSCPPYGDLEEYSDDPDDLSNMEWDDFLVAYRDIIAKSVALLRDDSFACFVVGDFRDKAGYYRNFVAETTAAFEAAGAYLCNDAVLATPIGTAAFRVTRQFAAGRKMAKVHQNILVFCKGNMDIAAQKVIASMA